MADQNPGSNSCNEAQAAVEGADRLIDRLQDKAVEGIKPGGDSFEAVVDIVEELETAPEIAEVRKAAGSKPRWGTGKKPLGAAKLDQLGPHSDVPEGP